MVKEGATQAHKLALLTSGSYIAIGLSWMSMNVLKILTDSEGGVQRLHEIY